MMNIILGGGLIALLARDILGSKWTVIPMGKSLYYSFKPALADDFLIRDDSIDDYTKQWGSIPIYHKIGYSIAGQITHNHALSQQLWLDKTYRNQVPPQASPYWRTHMEYFGCGNCGDIYRRLQSLYIKELVDSNNNYGKVVSIKNRTVTTTTGKTLEYDRMVNTIPYDALLKMLGVNSSLPALDMYCYHVATKALDFEGCRQLFCCDEALDFYKVDNYTPERYVFYANKKIEQPGRYFMALVRGDFDLIGETVVPRAIPQGIIPEFREVTDNGITCIGSTAAWDDCQDVGTCIKRLLKL